MKSLSQKQLILIDTLDSIQTNTQNQIESLNNKIKNLESQVQNLTSELNNIRLQNKNNSNY